MNLHPLATAVAFNNFSLLCLNERGRFVRPAHDRDGFSDGEEVLPSQLPVFLRQNIVLPAGVTDVFVWIHGWNNTHVDAVGTGRMLFQGIQSVYEKPVGSYPNLQRLVPAFILVRWPSLSGMLSGIDGYRTIRDRASDMTDNGDAEFFLASLLGYLDKHNRRVGGSGSKTLAAAGGYFVHCVGHSFGGRFITAAIRSAANPTPRTLSLAGDLPRTQRKVLGVTGANGFRFTVDSALVFQMAAPCTSFDSRLLTLVKNAPFRGPLVLTYSVHDTANCFWHKRAEGEKAIGCCGAIEPADYVKTIPFRELSDAYTDRDFSKAIVNVNADQAFTASGLVTGAHSDFWYEESIHLLLCLVSHAHS